MTARSKTTRAPATAATSGCAGPRWSRRCNWRPSASAMQAIPKSATATPITITNGMTARKIKVNLSKKTAPMASKNAATPAASAISIPCRPSSRWTATRARLGNRSSTAKARSTRPAPLLRKARKARASGRRARCRLSPEARRAQQVPRPGSANPNVATWGVRLVVQAAAARRRATRLHLGSVRSRAAMLSEAWCRALVELCEQRQVIRRDCCQRDEGSEQQHVGHGDVRERRRARTPEREALQVAPGPRCECGEAVEAGDVPEDERAEQRLGDEQAPRGACGLRLRCDRAHHAGDQGCGGCWRPKRFHPERQGYRLLMLAAAVRTGDQVIADGSCRLRIVVREVAIDVRLQKYAHARAREGIHYRPASSDSASELRSRARAR